MHIGVPLETKPGETRVAMTPAGARELSERGHQVTIETGAGVASGFRDEAYAASGASIVDSAADAWAASLVLKVKEPIGDEYQYLREDLVLLTYLHLAADKNLTEKLMESGTVSFGYETVQLDDGSLPLLAPMSKVAGRMAAIVGANMLTAPAGGTGVLMSGLPGTEPANVTVLGAGTAGSGAVAMATGMGADVTVLDTKIDTLEQCAMLYGSGLGTRASTSASIEKAVLEADLVIGTVLIPGASAPKLVPTSLIEKMRPGAAMVDVAVDQGGCFEGTRPTTHDDPTFRLGPATLYCVDNMPAAFPTTATEALTNSTLRYATAIADLGWKQAAMSDPALKKGLSTAAQALTNQHVGASLDLPATDPDNVLE